MARCKQAKDDELAEIRNKEIIVFQTSTCCSRTTALAMSLYL
jgi:hypothetical protein